MNDDMNLDDRDVHTEHCCAIDGCKYGDAACTVINRQKKQSYMCGRCEGWEYEAAEEESIRAAERVRVEPAIRADEAAKERERWAKEFDRRWLELFAKGYDDSRYDKAAYDLRANKGPT